MKRPPSNFERAVADAVGRVARQAAAKVVETLTTRRPSAMALPANNAMTDVEVTLVGAEEANREYLDQALTEAIELTRPAMKANPVVLILNTKKSNEYLVLVQFSFTLECSAAQAEQRCHEVFAAMVDGRSCLGYAFAITGVR